MKVFCKDCEWFEDSFLNDLWCTPKKPENIEEKFDYTYGKTNYFYNRYVRKQLNSYGACRFFTKKDDFYSKPEPWYKKLLKFFKRG